MKDDTPGRSGTRARLRGALVVAQVAVSLMLLVSAGLVFRGLEKARHIDAGFDPRGVGSASVDLQPGGYTKAAGPVFLDRLLQEVRSDASIESASVARYVPLALVETGTDPVDVEGYAPARRRRSSVHVQQRRSGLLRDAPDHDAGRARVRGRRRCRGAEGGDCQRNDGAAVLGESGRGDRQTHRERTRRLAHHRRRGARCQVRPAERDAAAVCLPGGSAELPIGDRDPRAKPRCRHRGPRSAAATTSARSIPTCRFCRRACCRSRRAAISATTRWPPVRW